MNVEHWQRDRVLSLRMNPVDAVRVVEALRAADQLEQVQGRLAGRWATRATARGATRGVRPCR